MGVALLTFVALCLGSAAQGAPTIPRPTGLSASTGTFVADMNKCPRLPPRKTPPKNIHDLRPDDISVVMALGDSITAAAFAKGLQPNVFKSYGEWRGVSYAIGMDPGAITVPNIMKHYNPALVGGSKGVNYLPEICLGPICSPTGWSPEVDQLNAARSAARARNMRHEAEHYIVPQLADFNATREKYKYMNVHIGSNDVCQICGAHDEPDKPLPGSPDKFEADMRDALEYVRLNIPNTVVNLVGVIKVSSIYELTRNQKSYCSKPSRPLPRYPIWCKCAVEDGAVGDWYRTQTDKLTDQYNERLLGLVKYYQKLNDPTFAVLWQPAEIPLAKYPIESLSDVDCYHPSTANHARIAASVWNRLTLGVESRKVEFGWTDDVMMRCLEDNDRIQTKADWSKA